MGETNEWSMGICSICGKQTRIRDSLCNDCYYALPKEKQEALESRVINSSVQSQETIEETGSHEGHLPHETHAGDETEAKANVHHVGTCGKCGNRTKVRSHPGMWMGPICETCEKGLAVASSDVADDSPTVARRIGHPFSSEPSAPELLANGRRTRGWWVSFLLVAYTIAGPAFVYNGVTTANELLRNPHGSDHLRATHAYIEAVLASPLIIFAVAAWRWRAWGVVGLLILNAALIVNQCIPGLRLDWVNRGGITADSVNPLLIGLIIVALNWKAFSRRWHYFHFGEVQDVAGDRVTREQRTNCGTPNLVSDPSNFAVSEQLNVCFLCGELEASPELPILLKFKYRKQNCDLKCGSCGYEWILPDRAEKPCYPTREIEYTLTCPQCLSKEIIPLELPAKPIGEPYNGFDSYAYSEAVNSSIWLTAKGTVEVPCCARCAVRNRRINRIAVYFALALATASLLGAFWADLLPVIDPSAGSIVAVVVVFVVGSPFFFSGLLVWLVIRRLLRASARPRLRPFSYAKKFSAIESLRAKGWRVTGLSEPDPYTKT